jgi:hypothetical protein
MHSARRFKVFRLGSAVLLGGLVLALTGDRGVYTAVPGGIDPLEVLNLAVRPNALIVLDSSGSMREMSDADYSGGTPTTPADGEVAGDDQTSKMAQAKAALRTVVQANESKVSFQFGRYVQDVNSYGPEADNRFLYTKTCANTDVACNNGANAILVDCGGDAACGIGLYRVAAHRRTVGANTTYHLFTNRFYNGQNLRVRTNGTNGSTFSTGTPGTLQLDDPPPVLPTDPQYPYVFVQNINNANNPIGSNVRFDFKGIRWNKGNANASCGGFESLVNLAPCTDNIQFDTIGPHLDPELEITAAGGIAGYTNQAAGNFGVGAAQRPPMRGIRASGFTPIAETLIDFKTIFDGLWTGSIAAMTPKPQTFAIFLTDGDDTCTGPTSADSSTGTAADNRALRAAHKAQLLYERLAGGNPASSVTVFVVVFGTGASASRADWVAWGGSGMNQTGVNGTPAMCGIPGKPACIGLSGAATNPNTRWNTIPTAAQRAGCTSCRDAFRPTTLADLTAALQTAIDQGQAVGEFSDQQSITESIFELAGGIGPTDPDDPATRYDFTRPVLLQSTFEMPGFRGHLNAFRNELVAGVETSVQVWDAGQLLTDRVANSLGNTVWSFAQLRGGTASTDVSIATSAPPGTLQRRIYTTTRNGVFLTGPDSTIVNNLTTPRYTPPGQIVLWPPDATVDPPSGPGSYPAGVLDDELGISTLTLAQLQAEFLACTASVAGNLHADCRTTASAAVRLARAKMEARRMILAYAAGAELVKAGADALRHTTTFDIQFQKRGWLIAESTLAAPAVVAPPLQPVPLIHPAEYSLYRDGPRDGGGDATNGIANGFGLRNPDKDATSDAAPGPDTRVTLKPVMSVVYHGANDMLHAFQAETGQELWALVPYDQLGKLRELLRVQARDPHTYVIAAPIRFSDVFVPGPFSRSVGGVTVSGDGVWRTVLLFGRGIGGKHLTALDVTAPGPFTAAPLTTAPPIVMWNRGNPDTQDGTTTGTVNNIATDYTAYLKMGQTWSVPTIGLVTAADNVSFRRPGGVEYVAYLGSGYGSGAAAATEGSTIYTLDVLTGDVIAAVDVGDRAGLGYENAVVASPAGFNPEQLLQGRNLKNPAGTRTTRVYVGDIHGRVWRLMTNTPGAPPLLFGDLGANQPVGNAAALLDYAGTTGSKRPHVFVEAGNDNRVTPPPANTPPFRLYGLRDDDSAVDPNAGDGVNGPATVLFSIDLPNGYRGTTQPATAFADEFGQLGRVFFAGTRFNLPGTPDAPPPPPCRSSFDSIIFALAAESGNAAYDLNASGDDRFTEIDEQRVQAVRVAGGRLVVDTGLGAQQAPPPPAPPQPQPPAPSQFADVFTGSFDPATGLSRITGLVPFKMGSSVCR